MGEAKDKEEEKWKEGKLGEKRGKEEEKKGNSEKQGEGKTGEELNLLHLQRYVFYARSFRHCISLLAQPKQNNTY